MNLTSKQPVLVAHSLSVSGWLLGFAQQSHPPYTCPAVKTVFDSQALSRLLIHHYSVVESWELGEMAGFFFLAQLLVYSVDAEQVISREKLKLAVTFFNVYLFYMLIVYVLSGGGSLLQLAFQDGHCKLGTDFKNSRYFICWHCVSDPYSVKLDE